MKLIDTVNGPDAWVWDVEFEGARLSIGFDDFPCETTICPCSKEDEAAIYRLVALLSDVERVMA